MSTKKTGRCTVRRPFKDMLIVEIKDANSIASPARVKRGRAKLAGKFEMDALDLNALPADEALSLAESIFLFVHEAAWMENDRCGLALLRISLALQKKHGFRDSALRRRTEWELAYLLGYDDRHDEACAVAVECLPTFAANGAGELRDRCWKYEAWARILTLMGDLPRALQVCELIFSETGKVPEISTDHTKYARVSELAQDVAGMAKAKLWARREAEARAKHMAASPPPAAAAVQPVVPRKMSFEAFLRIWPNLTECYQTDIFNLVRCAVPREHLCRDAEAYARVLAICREEAAV